MGGIWVQVTGEALQNLGEVLKVGVLMGLKQITNLGDEGGLDGAGVNFVVGVSQLMMEAIEKVLHCQVKPNQNTDIHCAIQGQE